MSRSALIYARYSSDLQNAASIEDQVRLCRERLDQDQIAGSRCVRRPRDQWERTTRHAQVFKHSWMKLRAGRVDVVIAEALDRLSRDQEDIARIYKRLSVLLRSR